MKKLLYVGNKLSQHGHSISVIDTLGKQLEESGFILHYAGTSKNRYIRLLEMIFKTIFIGSRSSYILIDTYSTNAFWYAFLTGMISRVLKKKYITILHGGNTPARLKQSRLACNMLFKHSFVNVAVSGYLKKAFDDAGYQAITIPNNLDISNYTFKTRETFKPRLLWVRSFHKQYNPQMAIDVLITLLKDYPDTTLCMVGPDSDGSLAFCRSYALENGVESRVKFTGKMSQMDWASLSAFYDIYINTTYIDNTPVSVIEALALGLPVISTNVGGIPYLLENEIDSILVERGNYLEMAAAVKDLICNPEKAKGIVSSGRRKAESMAWEVVKEKWVALLE